LLGPGQSIGNYKILSKIGTGGMGAVFLAEHPLIGKRAAIKVIHRELANNRDVVSRFFQEARAVNSIGNDHIVQIHDFGVTPENDHFFIMEYLDGQTLAHVLTHERVMDVMRALHVGAQIAGALGAAHACGVIHRDLKPDNIMLMPRLGDPDFVKVLDFGLAKVFQDAPVVQTAAGVLLGTPQYMSPEACESRGGIDHRTDIYALGVLLFQMMTGKLPFEGQTMGEVLVKQVTALPPAPRGINAAIPPSVEQILLRCLAKPVEARFQSMGALREALLAPDAYLGSAPPMQPARSVAPGEMGFSAAQLAAHAAARASAQQQQAHHHHQQSSGQIPLPGHQQRTTLGTLAAPSAPGLIPPRMSAAMSAQQATIIADPYARSGPIPLPGLAPPNLPKMNTMRIATPLGYSSRPPRRVWPIVVALGLALGLGGGALAVWYFRKPPVGTVAPATDGAATTGQDIATDSAAGSAGAATSGTPGSGSDGAAGSASGATNPASGSNGASGSNAGSGATGSAATTAPRRTATVSFESVPSGAEVFAGKLLAGKTPFDMEIEVSPKELTFEFRLAGHKRTQKKLVVTASTSISVGLERGASTPTQPPRSTVPKTGSGNSLMRPGSD